MPVRIYDIAKKLGIESKEVLARAKEFGITGAKVPSSSLDKITAEYLEQQLAPLYPHPSPAPPTSAPVAPAEVAPTADAGKPSGPSAEPAHAPPAAEPGPKSIGAHAPIHIVTAPAEPVSLPGVVADAGALSPTAADAAGSTFPSISEATLSGAAPAVVPGEAAPSAPITTRHVEAAPVASDSDVEPSSALAAPSLAPAAAEVPAVAPALAEPIAPPPPPLIPAGPPPPPKVGDKVGFIKLPTRPVPRQPERPPFGRPQARGPVRPGMPPGRPEVRDPRGGVAAPRQPERPGTPGVARAETGRPAPAPAAPAPRFTAPAGGELISLKPPIVVRDLAEQLRRKPFQLIADLMEMGVFANVNQAIDEKIAQQICAKHGFRFELEKRERGGGIVHAPVRKVETDLDDNPEELRPRAPVVTIMGHVDHGKTSLLDVIRKSNVVAGEAGGITQHIGAYTITIPHPEKPEQMQQITFLDTPGHAAFSSMRARGANVTDIVVLVVAANDGVMPQTLEALSHARAARVPIIVAVNKCDHPNANPMRVRQQLQDKGLVCEEWGGETIFVDLSALTKQGVDKLLEMLVLQSEVMELKANPTRRARGNVIESGLAQGGPTATVLVRKGTLKVGDSVLCGLYWGRVRALINEEGKRQKEAGPSVAVKLLGLNGVPEAGVEFTVVEQEKSAREMSQERLETERTREKEIRPKVTLENLFDTLAADAAKSLRLVVKADTQGSVEAIVEALKKLEVEKVSLEIIHSAVGTITESDVVLASASKAIVLGFHTRIDNGVTEVAKAEGVQIKLYAIIYELIDEVKDSMTGLLEPVTKETVLGAAEVRKVFPLSKGGNVAGCVVLSGRIARGKVRVQRRKSLVFEGLTMSIRRFQDEVNEVRAGMECGMRLEGFNDFQPGDTIESYSIEKVAAKV